MDLVGPPRPFPHEQRVDGLPARGEGAERGADHASDEVDRRGGHAGVGSPADQDDLRRIVVATESSAHERRHRPEHNGELTGRGFLQSF